MPDTDESQPDLARSPSVADERRSQLAALIPEARSEGILDEKRARFSRRLSTGVS